MMADIDRRLQPLFNETTSPPPRKASMLSLCIVSPSVAVPFVRAWHSRLPGCQDGPWVLAFAATYGDTCFGVALWNNPSARMLPDSYFELRRMAIPDDAPHCTASWMLGAMARHIAGLGKYERLISYQDMDVHTGTIYRAAGWTIGNESKPRQRDRSKKRAGCDRLYRSDKNGKAPALSGKRRWELEL